MQENPVKSLIDTWPTRAAFAEDTGDNVEAVHKWAQSGRIPSPRQADVVRAAQRRGIGYVTADWMLGIHATSQEGAKA